MIRVLRVLEYTYDNAETAARDMKGWTHSVSIKPPGDATHSVRMTSATFPFDVIEWSDDG